MGVVISLPEQNSGDFGSKPKVTLTCCVMVACHVNVPGFGPVKVQY